MRDGSTVMQSSVIRSSVIRRLLYAGITLVLFESSGARGCCERHTKNKDRARTASVRLQYTQMRSTP